MTEGLIDMYLLDNTPNTEKLVLVIVLLCILAWIITRTFIGVLCYKLAEKKGYTGYFLTGFFLGIIGFVYVICLPDLIMRRYVKNCAKRNAPIEYHRQIVNEETDRVNEI